MVTMISRPLRGLAHAFATYRAFCASGIEFAAPSPASERPPRPKKRSSLTYVPIPGLV